MKGIKNISVRESLDSKNYENIQNESVKKIIESEWGPKTLKKSTLSALEKCVIGDHSKMSINAREVCKK